MRLLPQPTITYLKLTIETLQQLWNMFKVNYEDTTVVFTVNSEHIRHLVLVFLLLTLSR